ncbi:MAG: FtsQ-type POTRA domain-containing protein [Anaerolineales bacterium]|nr:FtsQ-type POTRA domain-containing protein [Anaerolineales bacterium]
MSERPTTSRAEQARQRRSERTKKNLQKSSRQQQTQPLSRVVSRAQQTAPLTSAPKKKQARHYDVIMGMPQFPARRRKFTLPNFPRLALPRLRLPRISANWRIGAALFALIFGAALIYAFEAPVFYVPSATVFGNTRIPSEEINGILGVSDQIIFSIQPRQLERRLRLNYPEITSAQVRVDFPNVVQVFVAERQPVLLWRQDGGFAWIDESGVAFRPRGEADLVVVQALDAPPAGTQTSSDPFSPPPFIQKDLADAARALAPFVPDGATLTYSAADGFGWTDPRGWTVAFGTSAHEMPLRIRVYEALVNSLLQENKTPQFISVVYPDGPYYRMSKAPTPIQQTQDETDLDAEELGTESP